jgi:uncharacterized protein YbjT (DUF2867 family)
VTVLGGTVFLGRRAVRRLLDHGFGVRAASRRPRRGLSPSGPNGAAAEQVGADAHNEASVAAALAGAHGAANAVGLCAERGGGRETFRAVHVEAAARVARLAREAGVARLVHVSGIGADPGSPSRYVRATRAPWSAPIGVGLR